MFEHDKPAQSSRTCAVSSKLPLSHSNEKTKKGHYLIYKNRCRPKIVNTSHTSQSWRCTWPLAKVSNERQSEFWWVKGQCISANTLQPVFDPIRTHDFLSGDDAAVGGVVPTCRPSRLSRAPETGGTDALWSGCRWKTLCEYYVACYSLFDLIWALQIKQKLWQRTRQLCFSIFSIMC